MGKKLPKETKFFEVNDLVNFRLTKGRADIRAFLNSLRVEGKDISLFMEQAIRDKAGLPSPVSSEDSSPREPQFMPQAQISPELIEQITNHILAKIHTQGISIAPAASLNATEPHEEPVKETVSDEVKKAVADALEWD